MNRALHSHCIALHGEFFACLRSVYSVLVFVQKFHFFQASRVVQDLTECDCEFRWNDGISSAGLLFIYMLVLRLTTPSHYLHINNKFTLAVSVLQWHYERQIHRNQQQQQVQETGF